jgi:hypothetical protein
LLGSARILLLRQEGRDHSSDERLHDGANRRRSTGGREDLAFKAIERMRRKVVMVLTGEKGRAPRTQSTAPLIVDLHPSREMVEDVNDSP